MAVKKRLGELLVEAGVISRKQLEDALEKKKEMKGRLGKVLEQLGFVTEQDIINVLEFQLGISQVNIKDAPPQEIVKLVPESLARQHSMLPVQKVGNRLQVAMVDPLNVVAIDDLKLHTRLDIQPAIAMEDEILRALDEAYGIGNEAKLALEELEVTAANVRDRIQSLEDIRGGEGPIVRVVNSIIQQAVKLKASDIHIEPQEDNVRVRLRLDGILNEVMALPLNAHPSVVSRVKIMADMDIAEKRVPQDGRIELKVNEHQVDMRISTLPTVFGEKIVIRLLDKTNIMVQLDRLGFSQEVNENYEELIRRPYGMILVTGPTGSGKTTTLYATLNEINTDDKNIITIEDPVEYVLKGINQTAVNTKAGLTFAAGLRSILRQDPDIIMVGEIRDQETAEIAIRSATTGHLVFSTLHTNDAPGTVVRLVDMGIEPFLVASSVSGVMSQRLVRTICPSCRTTYEVPPDGRERHFMGIRHEEVLTLYHGKGCKDCNETGYRGRLAINELMILTSKLREMILAGQSGELIRKEAIKQGMRVMKEDGINKVKEGITTIEEVMRVAYSEEIAP